MKRYLIDLGGLWERWSHEEFFWQGKTMTLVTNVAIDCFLKEWGIVMKGTSKRKGLLEL